MARVGSLAARLNCRLRSSSVDVALNRMKSDFVYSSPAASPLTRSRTASAVIVFNAPRIVFVSGPEQIVRCGSKRGAFNSTARMRINSANRSRSGLAGTSQNASTVLFLVRARFARFTIGEFQLAVLETENDSGRHSQCRSAMIQKSDRQISNKLLHVGVIPFRLPICFP